MREEILNWWKQSKKDFETAKHNRDSGDHYAAVFFCQQAVEKGLKALFMLKKGISSGHTHSLIFLANECGAPKNLFTFLKELTPEFVATRYPDIVEEAPFELYDENISYKFIKDTEVFIKWLENQIEKQ